MMRIKYKLLFFISLLALASSSALANTDDVSDLPKLLTPTNQDDKDDLSQDSSMQKADKLQPNTKPAATVPSTVTSNDNPEDLKMPEGFDVDPFSDETDKEANNDYIKQNNKVQEESTKLQDNTSSAKSNDDSVISEDDSTTKGENLPTLPALPNSDTLEKKDDQNQSDQSLNNSQKDGEQKTDDEVSNDVPQDKPVVSDDDINTQQAIPPLPALPNESNSEKQNSEENNIKVDNSSAIEVEEKDNISEQKENTKDVPHGNKKIDTTKEGYSNIGENSPELSNTDSSTEKKSSISKYKEELRSRRASKKSVPQVTEEDLAPVDNNITEEYSKVSAADFDSEQVQFINNEARVLTLPNDDVVLGHVTEEAKLKLMSVYYYLEIFWKNYNRLLREPQRMKVDRFIDNYEENFKK